MCFTDNNTFLITVYDGEGCFIEYHETPGTREEAEEVAKELCRRLGGRFYYVRALDEVRTDTDI